MLDFKADKVEDRRFKEPQSLDLDKLVQLVKMQAKDTEESTRRFE